MNAKLAELPAKISAWAATKSGAPLEMKEFPVSQKLKPYEVLMEVAFCGVCHSDIHLINNDWGISQYPLVPGHEIVGRILSLGPEVRHLKKGEWVGVGWQGESCHQCPACLTARENYCKSKSPTCVGHIGGYADFHIADSRFVFPIPEKFMSANDGGKTLAGVAPLFCGGATVFSPLKKFMRGQGLPASRVGVVGIGGLGHFAVQIASAMGFEVTAFSSSIQKNPGKKSEILGLGAKNVIDSSLPAAIPYETYDLIISTVNVDLPWSAYIRALRLDGTLCFVGVPPTNLSFSAAELMGMRRSVTSSSVASPSEILEMLEFCALHNITAHHERVAMEDVNEALIRVKEGKVPFRIVLENKNVTKGVQ